MGQRQQKYHITDNGDIYKVNNDGSFTSMGNAEKQVGGKKIIIEESLPMFEKKLLNEDPSSLTIDEIKCIACYSQNSDALLKASDIHEEIVIPILVERFEQGATFLEDAVLKNGCQYDDNFIGKLSIAKCKRKFNDDDILTELGKDKNPQISSAARSNPNYTGKESGCFGIVILFMISTLSIFLLF